MWGKGSRGSRESGAGAGKHLTHRVCDWQSGRGGEGRCNYAQSAAQRQGDGLLGRDSRGSGQKEKWLAGARAWRWGPGGEGEGGGCSGGCPVAGRKGLGYQVCPLICPRLCTLLSLPASLYCHTSSAAAPHLQPGDQVRPPRLHRPLYPAAPPGFRLLPHAFSCSPSPAAR